MKTIKNFFVSLFLVIAMPLSAAFAQTAFASSEGADDPGPAATSLKDESNVSHLNLSLSIPLSWYSQITKTDYENQSIFTLKTSDNASVFLFSVTKVTGDQWMKLKDQIKGSTIIENKDGFITFVQKTDVKKIKGMTDAQSQDVLLSLDAVVASIRVK